MSIYVEILVRAPMEALWTHTQTPALHERWDLRFSRIDYLPRESDAAPQRFRYRTRIGFGVEVTGDGETVGQREIDGSRVSALKFSSAAALSLIREGSGYWKYRSTPDGIQFSTRYDYATRYGTAGALFDRIVFRPLIGWATAWSFDRLRLWLERGIEPALAIRQMMIHVVARMALAAIFFYHGLVPKLFARSADEAAMLRDAGLSSAIADTAVVALGGIELAFAMVLLAAWRRRWPLLVCLAVMLAATVTVGLFSPRYLTAAFNPMSLNTAVASLAVIDLLVLEHVPSAARCLRRPRPEQP